MGSTASGQVGMALRVVDDVWTELRRRTQWASTLSETPFIPSVSKETAGERARRAGEAIATIEGLDVRALPRELAVTVQVAAWHAERWVNETRWYDVVFDPSGIFLGLFAPTAYCGGYFLNGVLSALGRFHFAQSGDLDRYLALIADFERVLCELRIRTAEQAACRIYMPEPQLEQAAPLLAGLKARSITSLSVEESRLEAVSPNAFLRELERRLQRVASEYDAFADLLASPSYATRAPETVGIAQYPGGEEIYRGLIRENTTLDLAPKEVHELGLERMASIRDEMAAILREDGAGADIHGYYARVNANPQWRRETELGVSLLFKTYLDRIEPKMHAYFAQLPQAIYGVAPLPDALAGSMTFGYYDPPAPGRRMGLYMFNARNLTQRGLLDIGPLTYHELIPGHHLQVGGQMENKALHPLRVHSYFNAFGEGWAEYAATLAGEMGMYQTPEERFGRLAMDAFLSSRLVVDTGMNALGWSLERARLYMSEHTCVSEAEIRTETVRYSCDIPAQCLAYKIGEPALMRMREKMRAALGDRFDVRKFHRLVLAPGAQPFAMVEERIDRAIARETAIR